MFINVYTYGYVNVHVYMLQCIRLYSMGELHTIRLFLPSPQAAPVPTLQCFCLHNIILRLVTISLLIIVTISLLIIVTISFLIIVTILVITSLTLS